jgi:hypothetical protein
VGAVAHQRAPSLDFAPRHRYKKVDERQFELFEGAPVSRKVCRRKIWATKGFDAVAHAIAGCLITNDATIAQLQTRELSALEAITHGNGTVQDWRDLADVVNLCETAARMGIGPEALPSCTAAQAALVEAAHRFEKTGRMGLTGEGIQAIRDAIGYHDLQRRSIARSEYEKIIRETANRVRARAPEVIEI